MADNFDDDSSSFSPCPKTVPKRFNPNTPNSAASPSVRRTIKKTRVVNEIGDQNLDLTAMPLDETQTSEFHEAGSDDCKFNETLDTCRDIPGINVSENTITLPSPPKFVPNIADANLEESVWNLTLDHRNASSINIDEQSNETPILSAAMKNIMIDAPILENEESPRPLDQTRDIFSSHIQDSPEIISLEEDLRRADIPKLSVVTEDHEEAQDPADSDRNETSAPTSFVEAEVQRNMNIPSPIKPHEDSKEENSEDDISVSLENDSDGAPTVVSNRTKYAAYNDSHVSFLEMEARFGSESVDSLTSENNRLKEDLVAAHNLSAKLRNELSVIKNVHNPEAINELREMKEKLKDLQETMKKTDQAAVEANENLFLEQHKSAKLSREIEKNEMVLQNLKEELDVARQSMTTYICELESTKNNKNNEFDLKLQEKMEANVLLSSQVEALMSEIASLNTKISLAEEAKEVELAENKKLSDEQLAAVTLENEQKVSETAEIQRKLEQSLEQLNAKLVVEEELLADRELAFEMEISSVRAQLTALNEQLIEKESTISQSESSAQTELAQLKEQLAEMEILKDTRENELQMEISSMKEELEGKNLATQRAEELSSQVEALMSEISSLNTKITLVEETKESEFAEKKKLLDDQLVAMTLEKAQTFAESAEIKRRLEQDLGEVKAKLVEKEEVLAERELAFEMEISSVNAQLTALNEQLIEKESTISQSESSAQAELAQLKEQLAEMEVLQNEILSMKDELEGKNYATQRAEELSSQVEALMSEIASLNTKISLAEEAKEVELAENKKLSDEQLAAVTLENEQKVSETAEIQRKLEQSLEQLNAKLVVEEELLADRELAFEMEISSVRAQLTALNEQLIEKESTISQSESSAQTELAQLKEQLAEMEILKDTRENELQMEISSMKDELEGKNLATQRAEELSSQVEALMSEISSLNTKITLVEETKESEFAEKKKLLDDQLVAMTLEKAQTFAESAEIKRRLEQDLGEVKAKLVEKEEVLAERELAFEMEISSVNAQLTALNEQLIEKESTISQSESSAQAELAQLKEQLAEMEVLKDTRENELRMEISSMKDELQRRDGVLDELSSIKSQLVSKTNESSELGSRLSEMFSTNAELVAELGEYKLKLCSLDASSKSSGETINILKDFNEVQKAAKIAAEQKVSELQIAMASLREENSLLQKIPANIDENATKISTLRSQIDVLRTEHEKLLIAYQTKEEEIQKLRSLAQNVVDSAKSSALESQLIELKMENERLLIVDETKEEEIQKLMAEVKKLRFDSDGLDMHHEIKRLRAEVERLGNECDEFDEIEEKMKAKIEEYEEQLGIIQRPEPKGPALLTAITEGVQPLSPERCDVPESMDEFYSPTKENLERTHHDVTAAKSPLNFDNTMDMAPNQTVSAVTPHANRTLGTNMNHTTLYEPAGGHNSSVSNKSLSESKRCAQQ